MTVLSSPTVKLNKRAKLMLILVVTFFAIPIIVLVSMTMGGAIDGSKNNKPQDVVATRVSSTQSTIAWTTTRSVSATVEYGTTPGSLQTYAPEVAPTKEHKIDLTLLSPATTYYYHIRINGSVYDNNGVPWTFTTKTIRGEEVVAAVKGVTTKLSVAPSATPTPQFGTSNCTVTKCNEIKAHLGKGCSVSDYIQCIATDTSHLSTTLTPSPTSGSVYIANSACKLSYLQVGDDCTQWSWDSFNTKSHLCRTAFNRYVIQCRDKSFTSTNTEDHATWYFNGAQEDIASNSATLTKTPTSGTTIYCQVRAEDSIGGDGHATAWVQEDYTCQ